MLIIAILLLASFGLTRGSFPLPAGTLARALFAPENVGDQPRFILFDIRLPRLLMALLCGAMLGWRGGDAEHHPKRAGGPGLIGVKEGASVVVLALILFFPPSGWSGARWPAFWAGHWWRCWCWYWPGIARGRASF